MGPFIQRHEENVTAAPPPAAAHRITHGHCSMPLQVILQ